MRTTWKPLRDPQFWLTRAERVKRLAAATHDPIIRRQLLDVSRNYEILAAQCAKLGPGEEGKMGAKRE